MLNRKFNVHEYIRLREENRKKFSKSKNKDNTLVFFSNEERRRRDIDLINAYGSTKHKTHSFLKKTRISATNKKPMDGNCCDKAIANRPPTPRFCNIKNSNFPSDNLKVNVNARKRPVNYYVKKDTSNKYDNFVPGDLIYYPTVGLPSMGWIQACIMCHDPTTMIERVDRFRAYCCGKCSIKYPYVNKIENVSKIINLR